MKIKIIMNNGSEYHVIKTIEEMTELRNSQDYEIIKIKDYKKNRTVNIKLDEIASIEQCREPEFTAKWM